MLWGKSEVRTVWSLNLGTYLSRSVFVSVSVHTGKHTNAAWSADVPNSQQANRQIASCLDSYSSNFSVIRTDKHECVEGGDGLMKAAQWTYDPRKTHLQTYLSLGSPFHCHRFPWKPGKAGSLCARACERAHACERKKGGESLQVRKSSHHFFNTWLFPLETGVGSDCC